MGQAPAAAAAPDHLSDDLGAALVDDAGAPLNTSAGNALLAAIMSLAKEMRAKMATFAEQIDTVTRDLTTHNTELADRLKELDARLEAMAPGSTVTQAQVDALVAQVVAAQKNADAAAALLAIRTGAAGSLPITSVTATNSGMAPDSLQPGATPHG